MSDAFDKLYTTTTRGIQFIWFMGGVMLVAMLVGLLFGIPWIAEQSVEALRQPSCRGFTHWVCPGTEPNRTRCERARNECWRRYTAPVGEF